MSLGTLIVNCISIAISAGACLLYFKRCRDSRSIHYAALFIISVISLIIAIVGVITSRWIWQADMVLELARVFIVLHLAYLWLGSMHEANIKPSPLVLQRATMALVCVYVIFDILNAILHLRVLTVLALIAALVQTGLCGYLWHCSRGEGVGLERKRTQMLRLVQLSALFVLTSIFGLTAIGFFSIIFFWIWVSLTLFPSDALLYYGDKPAAFESGGERSIAGGNMTMTTNMTIPQPAHTSERMV
ncbi:hypothetical protein BDF19DRAFT_303925 [Syncephalis fuscata]|nr:hypothetical protein BDF19DRAFT_303925 [Syncephalis fuscata]